MPIEFSLVDGQPLPGWDDDELPMVVQLPGKWGPVYSIWENGDWWRNTLSMRRAWSTPGAAQDRIVLDLFDRRDLRLLRLFAANCTCGFPGIGQYCPDCGGRERSNPNDPNGWRAW
jgi:hypothetical protein